MASASAISEPVQISKTLLPRRGDTATMASTKANIILCKGEIFLEYPNTGPGTKGLYRIKVGDGVTRYKDLPYAIGNTDNMVISIKEEDLESIDWPTVMRAVKNGADVSTAILNIKYALLFLKDELDDHIVDEVRHITAEERERWDNSTVSTGKVSDCNECIIPGHKYYANPSNGVYNKPDGVDSFYLEVSSIGELYLLQTLTEANNHPGRLFTRVYDSTNSTWSKWGRIFSDLYFDGTIEKAIKDNEGRDIESTYLKSVEVVDTPGEIVLETGDGKSDKQKTMSHTIKINHGDDSKYKEIVIEEQNTQYQLHTNSDPNEDIDFFRVKGDGEVELHFTSTDDTDNVIKFEGDKKGSNVKADGDTVIVSTDYNISTQTHYVTYDIIDPEWLDKFGNMYSEYLRNQNSEDESDHDKELTTSPKEVSDDNKYKDIDTWDFKTQDVPKVQETNAEGVEIILTDINGNQKYIPVTGMYQTHVTQTADGLQVSTDMDIDASHIVSGIIDAERMPAGSMERLVKVQDEAAMLTLTSDDVQNGDTVYIISEDIMYMVIDDTKLDQKDEGYVHYKSHITTKNIISFESDVNQCTKKYLGTTHKAEVISGINECIHNEIKVIDGGTMGDNAFGANYWK